MEHNVCKITSTLSSYIKPIELCFLMATKQQEHHAHPIRPSLDQQQTKGRKLENKQTEENHSLEKTFRCVSATK